MATTNQEKIVLILHGWPQPINDNNIYYEYFSNKGFTVIAPNLYLEDFKLGEKHVSSSIINKLNDKNPDVILGISMGGLLAPWFGLQYPNAKLILLATGPKLKPNAFGFNLLLKLTQISFISQLANIIRYFPRKILFIIYQLINPFKGNSNEKKLYIADMKLNIKEMLKYPIVKHIEIANFITKIDNSKILKKIENKTLIFTSDNDSLMPSSLGKSLGDFIPKSKIIFTKGSHFEVFTHNNFKDIDRFLEKN